jgi:hypothetical protein
LGGRQPGHRETDRRREDAMMRNESEDHRRYTNIYSIDCRTGEESDDRSGLERGRSHEVEGRRVDCEPERFGLIDLGVITDKWNRDESRDIEKSERSVGTRLQALVQKEALAMERIEPKTENLRTWVRGLRSPLTIRMEEIERRHRKEKYLR